MSSFGRRPRGAVTLLAVVLGVLVAGDSPARASIAVTSATDEVSDNGQCSLREAITVLNEGTAADCTNTATDQSTINVPAGDYKLTLRGSGDDSNETGDLDLLGSMTIQGAGAGTTFIDGDSANAGGSTDRVLDVVPGLINPIATINGVTVENGQAPAATGLKAADGGGIRVGVATLTLNDDIITNNSAGQAPPGVSAGSGGGIASRGTLTVNTTSIDHNAAGDAAGDAGAQAGKGGGVFEEGASTETLTVSGSTVAANSAGHGSNGAGSPDGGEGGGIYDEAGAPVMITASTISDNHAGDAGSGGGGGGRGGGVWVVNALTLVNSTVAGNEAGDSSVNFDGGDGGGVWTFSTPATLTNDTIAGNAAGDGGAAADPGDGGGIRLTGSVANSIVASNTTGGNCASVAFVDAGHNIGFGDATCPGTFSTGDPNLGPLADYGGPTETMAIATPSAAVDQIPSSGSGCPAADQRGIVRPKPSPGMCDIGAFELRTLILGVSTTGTGTGSVMSSPSGINCGATCGASYEEQKTITLTATPAPGSAFNGWSGGGCSGTSTCVVKLTVTTGVVADFELIPPPNTKIAKAKIDQAKNRAKFTFRATGGGKSKAGPGFQCALAKGHGQAKFKSCDSPKTYEHLKKGSYTFEVRAFDADGKDMTPARKTFRIK